jgi:DNA-binding transcriptional ArsR family regulator
LSRGDDPVWRALADPTRRAILDLLAERARTTGEVCAHFAQRRRGGLSRTGVMKHLGLLEGAGLVVVRREGRQRWNHLNPVPIQRVCDRWVSRHVRGLARSADRLKALLEDAESGEGFGEGSPTRR